MKLPASSIKMRNAHPSRAGWVQLAYFAVVLALSYLAGQLLAKKRKSPIEDNKPTTLTARGSYTPYVIGVRRIGPVFAFAGDRRVKKEKASGGKGLGSSPKQEIWYESGWHQLGPGPLKALHQIIQQGKIIFKGPITPLSHPSGTTVDLGKEGSFQIWWGEEDQPVNTFLADPSRIGIASGWPFMASVCWTSKRLGTSPQWSVLDYIIETEPHEIHLSQTPSTFPPTETLGGPLYPLTDRLANANPDIGFIQILGDLTQEFPSSYHLDLQGTGLANGQYTIRRTTTVQVSEVVSPDGRTISKTHTKIFLEGGTAGATISGTVQLYSRAPDDGVNLAHAIAEMLFSEWPYGRGLDPNGEEPWDLDSLEELGLLMQSEDVRSSILATGGDTIATVLGGALQDAGCMLPLDIKGQGRLKFVPIREPVGTLPMIQPDMQVQELPEQENNIDDLPVDRIVFSFDNRERQFVTDTITVDEDGQAAFAVFASADEIGIPTTVLFDSAAKIGERRSQEQLAGGARVPIPANRAAREFMPGDAIVAADFPDILRVVEVKAATETSRVTVTVMPDSYGASLSTFNNQPGGGPGAPADVAEDPLVSMFEIPEYLNTTGRMGIFVPHIRAHAGIISSAIHISRDNSTYTLVEVDTDVFTGGTTTTALNATDAKLLEIGPTITGLGPDIGTVQDLTADETNWKLGRQLAVIVSSAGTEICYLRNLEPLGGGLYRLRGLLRARYDTRRVTHPVGAAVFIFQRPDEQEAIFDVLLEPGEDLYLKSQPSGAGGEIPLANIAPAFTTLVGKGVIPMAPEALRVTAPRHLVSDYRTGEGVTVEWNYQSSLSSGTGAGMQGYGNATGDAAVDGEFEIQVTTTADVVKQTSTQVGTTFSLSNAEIIALLGSEVSFKIKIRNSRGGYQSSQISLTITKN